jgi:SulP family sulfate permease
MTAPSRSSSFLFTLGLCAPSGPGNHDRRCAFPAGFSLQEHETQNGFLSRDEDQALRCSIDHGPSGVPVHRHASFRRISLFANSSYLEDQIADIMLKKKTLKHIILVSNGINDIDASGEETLSLLVDRIRSAGLDISLSGVNETVMKVLKRTHFLEKSGKINVPNHGKSHSGSVHEKRTEMVMKKSARC